MVLFKISVQNERGRERPKERGEGKKEKGKEKGNKGTEEARKMKRMEGRKEWKEEKNGRTERETLRRVYVHSSLSGHPKLGSRQEFLCRFRQGLGS